MLYLERYHRLKCLMTTPRKVFLETTRILPMSTWDYKNEGTYYDRAVEGGDETFHDYMIERCRDSSFDWDRWDKATGDGYGRHN